MPSHALHGLILAICYISAAHVAQGAASATSSPAFMGAVGKPVALNNFLYGLNSVLGPIINISYYDTGLLAAVKAVRVGALRYPGGTVANYWSISNASYITPCSSEHYDFCRFEDEINKFPSQTFSPRNFWDGIGSVSESMKGFGPVYDMNIFTLKGEDVFNEMNALYQSKAAIFRIEWGNELYLKNYKYLLPNGTTYCDAVRPYISRARGLFPNAKFSFATDNGGGAWSQQLAACKDLFDAVTMHDYSPSYNTLKVYSTEEQLSVLAAWGELRVTEHVNTVHNIFGVGTELWMTEYNYGLQTDPLECITYQGLHGIFLASHILAGIRFSNDANPVKVMQLHAFLSEVGQGWDGKTGVVRISNEPNRPDLVTVGGVAQILAHMSYFGLDLFPWHSPLNATGGPVLPFKVENEILPCLQGASFSKSITKQPPYGIGWVVINRCSDDVQSPLDFSLLPIPLPSQITINVVSYNATDRGTWVPLPEDDTPPWSSGPLTPSDKNETISAGNLEFTAPGLTISFVQLIL